MINNNLDYYIKKLKNLFLLVLYINLYKYKLINNKFFLKFA